MPISYRRYLGSSWRLRDELCLWSLKSNGSGSGPSGSRVLAWLVSAANRLASEICFYGDCVHGSVHVVTNRLSYVVYVHVVAIKLRYAQGFHSQLLQLHSNPNVEHSRAPWLHALSRRASLRFMCPILPCLPLCYLESTISCQSVEEQIAQSSYPITYWDDKSTLNPINVERKVTQ